MATIALLTNNTFLTLKSSKRRVTMSLSSDFDKKKTELNERRDRLEKARIAKIKKIHDQIVVMTREEVDFVKSLAKDAVPEDALQRFRDMFKDTPVIDVTEDPLTKIDDYFGEK